MAKDPAVLFYTSDFLSGTFTMNYEQKGKYITLLCIQHQKGKLTKKDLQSVLDDDDIELSDKFELLEDGYYYNIKMKECAEKRKAYSESRSKNRKSKNTSDNPKNNIYQTYLKHMKDTSSSYVNHMENENENEIVNKNDHINEYDNNIITSKPKYKKIINGLLQVEDKQLFHNSWEDMQEVGFDIIAQNNNWSEDVYNNYVDRINSNFQIVNQNE